MTEEKDEYTDEGQDGVSDYENYWVDRDKIESLEDAVEAEDIYDKKIPVKPSFKETYTMNGEIVVVTIGEEFAFFEYSNGTSSEVSLSELKFCPSCVKEGKYPFSRHGASCPIHRIEYFNFDMKRYEEFKVISKLNGYHHG